MKVYVAFMLLGLCVLLASAKPRGGKQGGGRDRGATGETAGDAGRHGKGDKKGGKGGRGQRPERPDRPNKPGRGQDPEPVDPVCENLNCEKPTRDTIVCGTDGQTYRSECLLIKERCKGRIADTVEVASAGRCEGVDGRPLRGHGKEGREGKKPGKEGRRPAAGRKGGRPDKGRWPKECLDFIGTTIEPVTVEDEGPVCTAACPVNTLESPLQPVCGTDGRTYESACVLEIIACVTDNMELSIDSEGACQ